MQFSEDDLQRFAAWSGDRNPLHVDADFARSTPFGQPIAHGMLSVIDALATGLTPPGGPLSSLDIEFRGAVVPGVAYRVESTRSGAEVNVAVRSESQAVLTLVANTAPAEAAQAPVDLSWLPEHAAALAASTGGPRREPAARTIGEFEAGIEIVGAYRTSPGAWTSPLAGPAAAVLGLCSYLVGMEIPGLQSLFTRVTLRFSAEAGSAAAGGARPHGSRDAEAGAMLWYRARTVRFDRHFRLLDTQVDIATADGRPVAAGVLRSYVPFGRLTTDLDSLSPHLSAAAGRLKGLVALVCGGSRGLGADISAALALAGCHVYASAREDSDAAADLRLRLEQRGFHLEFVQGDAGDPAWCEQTLARIRSTHGRLDLLVLNACSAPSVLRIAPDASARHDEYVPPEPASRADAARGMSLDARRQRRRDRVRLVVVRRGAAARIQPLRRAEAGGRGHRAHGTAGAVTPHLADRAAAAPADDLERHAGRRRSGPFRRIGPPCTS